MVVILIGCRQQNNAEIAVVSGKFPEGIRGEIRLSELTPEQVTGVDSVSIAADGNFRLVAHPVETGLYILQFDDENEKVVLLLDKGDTLSFSADGNGFYKITGNEDSRLLMQYANTSRQLRLTLDSLGSIVLESRSQEDFVTIKTAADQFVDSSLVAHRKFVQHLILQHPSSLASVLLVNTYFSGNPLFPVDSFPELYRIIADSTGAHYPGNTHVTHHKNRVERAMQQREQERQLADRLLPGRKLPAVTLPDENGNPTAVSSFNGQPLILFLWASWSPESRAAIQQLKALSTNIPILALSFDSDTKIWKAAVKIENTTWTHVNDPEGMSGAAAKLFGASRHLPYFILADSSGTIVASTAKFRELTEVLGRLE
ncbi:MAG TPA: TlpA disulfide reductase family protein [Bacteroidales bacterium]|nr:TlpA disulfide reductase family protein [Bacteroidales bacterium]